MLPQESIVGTILFSVFLKDFFNTNEKASAHNFADSNTLSVFAKTTHELVHWLKWETKIAVIWFSENKMIFNPDKFKAIVVSKNKPDYIRSGFSVGDDSVTIEQSVRLLGIDLDNLIKLIVYSLV